MNHDPRHPHCLIPDGGRVTALRANDPHHFKRWLFGWVQDLGEPVMEVIWLAPFLKMEEQDRLLAGHPGLSL